LFQVQPLVRAAYGESAHGFSERDGLGFMENGEPAMTAEHWVGYRKTIRVQAPGEVPESSQYTAATRKRTKHRE